MVGESFEKTGEGKIYGSKTPTSNTPFFDQEKSSKKESEKTLIQLELFL